MFRRRVESEVKMMTLLEIRPYPGKMANYLKQSASFMKTPLCAALFKVGMLDCVHFCDKPDIGFA